MPQILIAISILAPILGAGLATAHDRQSWRRPWRRAIPLASIVLAGLCILLLHRASPGSLQVSAWLAAGGGQASLTLSADRLSLAFALLLLAWVAAAEVQRLSDGLAVEAEDGGNKYLPADAARLLASASGLVFLLAGNLVSLAFAWTLVEAVLWLVRRTDDEQRPGAPPRWMAANIGAILAIVAAAGLAGASLGLAAGSAAALSTASRGLLALAAVIRAGAYPFQAALSVPRDETRIPLSLLLPVLAGLYLLVRTEALGPIPVPPASAWILLGSLGLLATAFLVRSGGEGERGRAALPWIALHTVSLVVLLAGITHPLAGIASLLLAVNLPLSVGVLNLPIPSRGRSDSLAERRGEGVWVGMRWLAAASLAGLPPTLGFAGRWLAYRVLGEAGSWLGVIVVTLASIPLAVSLLDQARADGQWAVATAAHAEPADLMPPERAPALAYQAWIAGPAVLAVPLALLGLFLPLLGGPAQAVASGQVGVSPAEIVANTPPGIAIVTLLALLVSVGGAVLMTGRREWTPAAEPQVGRSLDWLANALTLNWAYRLIRRGGHQVMAFLAVLLTPLRGERYVTWTVLLAVILLLFVLGR